VKAKVKRWTERALLTLVGCLALGCQPDEGPRTGSQTNWLRACVRDAECGSSLACGCGVCTRACDTQSSCDSLSGAVCVGSNDPGAIGVCNGQAPAANGLCLPPCEAGQCPNGQTCVAGVCSPLPEPTARVVIDASGRHQSLTGFGATLAYAESDILLHPRKSALCAAMFQNLGLDMIRLRNHYGYAGEEDLSNASELVALATDSLARKPAVILTSWSPPAALKASGAIACQGNADTCTLAKSADGSFDYAGYASYWRTSLDNYAAAGILPDYIGIQNNPDFVPTATEPGQGCRFLPTEGSLAVPIDGSNVTVEYPGLVEATRAVANALLGLQTPPKLIAPESSSVLTVPSYLAAMDLSTVDAIAHHLYGMDPNAVDTASLSNLGALARNQAKPLFQTEAKADGFGTALLMHYALVVEGASAYLQSVLARAASITPADPATMIALGADDFVLKDPYHAMRHYAFYMDPGWVRVDATSDVADLLVSAWQAPDETALTVVLVNASTEKLATKLDLGTSASSASRVVRTVFDGVERSAELGAVSADGTLTVPGRSIVTVAFTR
jgi:glucuronoarabinoxylan endo-1,4-beta-xylanase